MDVSIPLTLSKYSTGIKPRKVFLFLLKQYKKRSANFLRADLLAEMKRFAPLCRFEVDLPYFEPYGKKRPCRSVGRNWLEEKENSTNPLMFGEWCCFVFYIVCSIIPSVITDLHVFGGVFENLGKGFVRLFLNHVGNLAVGFLQDFNRLALLDLLIVLV